MADARTFLTRFNVLTARPVDNTNGLVGWWTFDPSLTDFSGNGIVSSIQPGAVLSSLDIAINAMALVAGSSAGLSVPTPPFVFNDFSVSCWIKIRTGANQQVIANFQNGNPLVYFQVGPALVGAPNFTASVGLRTNGGGLFVCSGGVPVGNNSWRHSFYRDAIGQVVNIYVDGNLDGQTSYADAGTINVTGAPVHWLVVVSTPGLKFKISAFTTARFPAVRQTRFITKHLHIGHFLKMKCRRSSRDRRLPTVPGRP